MGLVSYGELSLRLFYPYIMYDLANSKVNSLLGLKLLYECCTAPNYIWKIAVVSRLHDRSSPKFLYLDPLFVYSHTH